MVAITRTGKREEVKSIADLIKLKYAVVSRNDALREIEVQPDEIIMLKGNIEACRLIAFEQNFAITSILGVPIKEVPHV